MEDNFQEERDGNGDKNKEPTFHTEKNEVMSLAVEWTQSARVYTWASKLTDQLWMLFSFLVDRRTHRLFFFLMFFGQKQRLKMGGIHR